MVENQPILISSRSFGKTNSRAIEILKDVGMHVLLNPHGRILSEEEIIEYGREAIGVIAGTEKYSANVINNMPSLKVISRYGVGLDNVDLKAAGLNNVLVFNTPHSPSQAVAELTIVLILSLLRKIPLLDSRLRSLNWQPESGGLLLGKTVGVIGLGCIGRKVVQIIKPFGVDILASEINPNDKFINQYNIELLELSDLFKKSDIVTIHVPLTSETRHMINKKSLVHMKKTAMIINTSRGEVINEADLFHALNNKAISGAALDVFSHEPYEGELTQLDNVVLTPHIGSFTYETRLNMELEAAENLIRGLNEK
jgi:D-3-phosphoglycerate dehydrogenase